MTKRADTHFQPTFAEGILSRRRVIFADPMGDIKFLYNGKEKKIMKEKKLSEEKKEEIRELAANLFLCKVAISHPEEVVDPELIDRGLFSVIKRLNDLAEQA